METTTLKTAVLDAVKNGPAGLTPVDLIQRVGEAGDCYLTLGTSNIWTFFGLSDPLADAMVELIAERKIHLNYSDVAALCCAADGCPTPDLPRAAHLRNYKRPHYRPSVIVAGPRPEVSR